MNIKAIVIKGQRNNYCMCVCQVHCDYMYIHCIFINGILFCVYYIYQDMFKI